MKKQNVIYFLSLILLCSIILVVNYVTSQKDYVETYISDDKEEVIDTSDVYTEVHTIVNINTATKEEMMTLYGFGDKMAERVIQYREANGKFNTIEELMNVKGIGEEKFKKVKAYIEV